MSKTEKKSVTVREPGWYWVFIADEIDTGGSWDVVYVERDYKEQLNIRQIGTDVDFGFYGERIEKWGPRILSPVDLIPPPEELEHVRLIKELADAIDGTEGTYWYDLLDEARAWLEAQKPDRKVK